MIEPASLPQQKKDFQLVYIAIARAGNAKNRCCGCSYLCVIVARSIAGPQLLGKFVPLSTYVDNECVLYLASRQTISFLAATTLVVTTIVACFGICFRGLGTRTEAKIWPK